MGEAILNNLGGMSKSDLDKMDNNTQAIIDRLMLRAPMYFIYNSAEFLVPYDTGITIRACGAGGGGNNSTSSRKTGGGGGGGYVKDYREYKKGDIISITFSGGNVTITQNSRNLSLTANAGTDSTGGSATGGNILSVKGGDFGADYGLEGCAGGVAYGVAGKSGGFSGGGGYPGGTGGFSGGNGGCSDNSSSSYATAGHGGAGTWGVGGNGGLSQATSSGGPAGNGGIGYLAGGNGGDATGGTESSYAAAGKGGDCTGSSLYGKGGKGTYSGVGSDGQGAEGYPPFYGVPRRGMHGGGAAASGRSSNPPNAVAGYACCIIELGESIYPY